MCLTAAKPTRADSLSYVVTGTGITVDFTLPINPTIDPNNVDTGFGFTVVPTSLTINGVASSDFLAFYALADGGGFGAFSDGSDFDILTSGLQLYSGSESSPTMLGPSLLTLPVVLTDWNNALTLYTLTDSVVTGSQGQVNDGPGDPPDANIAEPSVLSLALLGGPLLILLSWALARVGREG